MLISDYHAVSNLQVIEEASASNNHRPKVRGLFQRADEANQNKRVYPRPLLEAQVNKLQPLIKERRLCGELDHPQNDTVKLTNASHLVTKLWMEGSEVMGEAEILNTPAGKVAQALISDGVKIGISSRGLGTLSEDQMTGTKTVNEDFNLVTFDLVADPSTRGAYPTIAESRILEEAKYERTLKEAVKERTFITMLKNQLHEAKGDKNWWDSADFGTEPEHLAARRRANKLAQDKINRDALKKRPPVVRRSPDTDVWHSQDYSQVVGQDPKKKNKKKKLGEHQESLRNRVRYFLKEGSAMPKEYDDYPRYHDYSDERKALAKHILSLPKEGRARKAARATVAKHHGRQVTSPTRLQRAQDLKALRSSEPDAPRMARAAARKLRRKPLGESARQVVEDAQKGYPQKGIKGGTKAARREAKRRGY